MEVANVSPDEDNLLQCALQLDSVNQYFVMYMVSSKEG